jgi:hypothetical protein
MTSLSIPARPLLDPVDGVAAAVEGRRWFWPLMLVMACVALSSVAVYARFDPTAAVVAEMTASGEITRTTEQELIEKIATTQRIRLVGGVAKGIFVMPLFVLVLAVVLKFTAWLFDRKAAFNLCFTAAAVALLPVALYHLVYAATAYYQLALVESQLETLLPSSLRAFFPGAEPKLARVYGAVDFFNLWSAGLLGLGFSAASGMSKGRSLAVGFTLYLLFAGVVMIGLPGMGGGGR